MLCKCYYQSVAAYEYCFDFILHCSVFVVVMVVVGGGDGGGGGELSSLPSLTASYSEQNLHSQPSYSFCDNGFDLIKPNEATKMTRYLYVALRFFKHIDGSLKKKRVNLHSLLRVMT